MTELWRSANAPLSDSVQVALTKRCRKLGWSDQQIRATAAKSVAWLRETDAINALDEKCWQAFQNGEINRAVALRLVETSDVGHRLSILDATCEIAAKRLAALYDRISKAAASDDRG